MPETDADLARQALAGSEAASRALVARYAAPAVNFAFRMVRERGLAEDLAQEAFLRAFQRLNSYDLSRRFASWFFQIVRNVTIDYLRAHRSDIASLDEMAEAGFQPAEGAVARSPERLAADGELAGAMSEALMRLRPEYREAVVLRYQEGFSHPEIADILGVPVGTVKTNLHRARKELADLLNPFAPAIRKVTQEHE